MAKSNRPRAIPPAAIAPGFSFPVNDALVMLSVVENVLDNYDGKSDAVNGCRFLCEAIRNKLDLALDAVAGGGR
jgi:hypothetical protein